MTTLVTRRKALIAFAAAGTAVPLTVSTMTFANAQTTPAEGGDQADYVKQTMMLGMMSMQTSELAAQKAQDPMVKEFATLELAEQQAVASILAATEAGKTPPEMPEDRMAMVQQLTDLEAGPEFDMAYVDGQMAAHQELLTVQQTLSGTSEATVEAITARLAEQGIMSHLAMLGHIQAALGGNEAMGSQQPPAEGEAPAKPAEGSTEQPPAEGAATEPAPTNG